MAVRDQCHSIEVLNKFVYLTDTAGRTCNYCLDHLADLCVEC